MRMFIEESPGITVCMKQAQKQDWLKRIWEHGSHVSLCPHQGISGPQPGCESCPVLGPDGWAVSSSVTGCGTARKVVMLGQVAFGSWGNGWRTRAPTVVCRWPPLPAAGSTSPFWKSPGAEHLRGPQVVYLNHLTEVQPRTVASASLTAHCYGLKEMVWSPKVTWQSLVPLILWQRSKVSYTKALSIRPYEHQTGCGGNRSSQFIFLESLLGPFNFNAGERIQSDWTPVESCSEASLSLDVLKLNTDFWISTKATVIP